MSGFMAQILLGWKAVLSFPQTDLSPPRTGLSLPQSKALFGLGTWRGLVALGTWDWD